MPCHPEYPEVTELEKEIGKVYHLLDELDGNLLDEKWWASGLHRNVTGKELGDNHLQEITIQLCTRLQQIKNVNEYSVELQKWWNNHRKADFTRLQKSLKLTLDKEKFIDSLNDYERQLIDNQNSFQ